MLFMAPDSTYMPKLGEDGIISEDLSIDDLRCGGYR
jgi:hypothetical protein